MAKTCSEFEIIQRFFSAGEGRRDDVLLGVGDDAALLRVRGDEALVVAVDTLVAGRRGLGGFTGALLGSVTRRVQHETPIAVLTVV